MSVAEMEAEVAAGEMVGGKQSLKRHTRRAQAAGECSYWPLAPLAAGSVDRRKGAPRKWRQRSMALSPGRGGWGGSEGGSGDERAYPALTDASVLVIQARC